MTSPQTNLPPLFIDGHTDSLDRRLAKGDPLDLWIDDPRYQLDLSRLRKSQVTAILSYCGTQDLPTALHLINATHEMCEAHPDDFVLALSTDDILQAHSMQKVAVILQLESLSCCMGSLDILRLMYRIGVRVGNLTHGEAPPHGCQAAASVTGVVSAEERQQFNAQPGLTDFGKAAIGQMNELGMVVDLAHINDRAFFEALEISTQPPIFSHGGVYNLCPQARGLTDEQIRALAVVGGVHGIACYTRFIHLEHPDVSAFVNQIEYSLNLVGPNHVGIGTDFDGLGDEGIAIPEHAGKLHEITDEMVRRNWDDDIIRKVLGGNFLRVFDIVMCNRNK